MAGKINPGHASMLEMICMKAQAHHAVVVASLSSARLQLNTTYLAAASGTLESAQVMAQGLALFASHLIAGLDVNHDRLEEHVRHGPGATFLQSRTMGYDAVAGGSNLIGH
jgi:fumarate hydratase class II